MKRRGKCTDRDLGLAQRWWHVQILGDQHVAKVVRVLHAPHGEPVDVVDGDVLR